MTVRCFELAIRHSDRWAGLRGWILVLHRDARPRPQARLISNASSSSGHLRAGESAGCCDYDAAKPFWFHLTTFKETTKPRAEGSGAAAARRATEASCSPPTHRNVYQFGQSAQGGKGTEQDKIARLLTQILVFAPKYPAFSTLWAEAGALPQYRHTAQVRTYPVIRIARSRMRSARGRSDSRPHDPQPSSQTHQPSLVSDWRAALAVADSKQPGACDDECVAWNLVRLCAIAYIRDHQASCVRTHRWSPTASSEAPDPVPEKYITATPANASSAMTIQIGSN